MAKKFETIMEPGAVGVVPAGTRKLPDGAFRGRMDMVDVVLPKSLRSIGTHAFKDCTSLLSVTLPPGLETIGDGAFEGCLSLVSVTIPDSLKEIGERVFEECPSLAVFRSGDGGRYTAADRFLMDNDDLVLVRYPPAAAPPSVFIGQALESVAPGAFQGCARMKTLDLRTHPEMGPEAFGDCPSLAFINHRPFLSSADGSELLFCPPGCPAKELYLPGIRVIGPGAFRGCRNVKTLILSAELEAVAPDAFDGFTGLQMILTEDGLECDLHREFFTRSGVSLGPDEIGGKKFRKRRDGSFLWVANYDTQVIEGRITPFEGRGPGDGPRRRPPREPPEPRGRSRRGEAPDVETAFQPVSVEGCSFADVAGLEPVKEEFREHLIMPAQRPDLYDKYRTEQSTGILLYGVPGTGKTLMARAVAAEIDAAFFSVCVSDILDKWLGESEQKLRDLFESARSHPRSVIFLDDIDTLAKKRGNDLEPWTGQFVGELLMQMQGLKKYDGTLIVLGATNRPWSLDSALMRSGRFSTRIEIPLPDRSARLGILRMNLEGVPDGGYDLESIADRTEGYNGADIALIVEKAKRRRISLIFDCEDEDRGVTMDDLEYALSRVPSSVSRKDVADIRRYADTGYGPGDGPREDPSEDVPYVPAARGGEIGYQ